MKFPKFDVVYVKFDNYISDRRNDVGITPMEMSWIGKNKCGKFIEGLGYTPFEGTNMNKELIPITENDFYEYIDFKIKCMNEFFDKWGTE